MPWDVINTVSKFTHNVMQGGIAKGSYEPIYQATQDSAKVEFLKTMRKKEFRKHLRSLKTKAEKEEAKAQRAKQAAQKTQIVQELVKQRKASNKARRQGTVEELYSQGTLGKGAVCLCYAISAMCMLVTAQLLLQCILYCVETTSMHHCYIYLAVLQAVMWQGLLLLYIKLELNLHAGINHTMLSALLPHSSPLLQLGCITAEALPALAIILRGRLPTLWLHMPQSTSKMYRI